MIKRTLIERTCPECKKTEQVRKDAVGKYCRSCRARLNHKTKKPKDIEGKKFGRILVISLSHISKHAYWNCKCDCGKECIISGFRLRNGHTKSCGCILSCRNGLSKSGSYRSWKAMIERCNNKNVPHYARYGAKGIKVCDRWYKSFENFYADMGERPEGKTLDRIDGNGNYELSNCRWITPKEQAKNKKSGCFISAFGQTLRLSEWAEKTGIGWSTIRCRIIRLNWEPEKALSKKVNKGKK